MKIELKELQKTRGKSGIYFLYDSDALVYIGYSSDIYTRVLEHKVEGAKSFSDIACSFYDDDVYSGIIEVFLINRLKPKYNIFVVNDFSEWLFSIQHIIKRRDITIEKIIKQDGDLLKYKSLVGAKRTIDDI